MKNYYVLAVYEFGKWHSEFGDYSKAVVKEELEYYAEIRKRKHLKLVTVQGDTTEAIIASVDALNN